MEWYAEAAIDTSTTTSNNHKLMYNEAYLDAHTHSIIKGRRGGSRVSTQQSARGLMGDEEIIITQ